MVALGGGGADVGVAAATVAVGNVAVAVGSGVTEGETDAVALDTVGSPTVGCAT